MEMRKVHAKMQLSDLTDLLVELILPKKMEHCLKEYRL